MKKQWIGIEEAAEKYQVSSKQLSNWCEKQEVICSKIGHYWMIDENSFTVCLERNKQLSLSDYEFKCKMYKIMGENEEELFLLNSLKELTPFIRLIIDELAGLIQNKKRREFFLYVVMKGSIREYSNEIGIRCTEAQKEFNSILREIKSRAGFLKTYREDLYRLRATIRLYEKKYGKEMLNEEIITLEEIEAPYVEEKKKAIELLQTPIEKFGLGLKIESSFTRLGILTLHDLLQITRKYGVGRLANYPYIGAVTLRKIIEQLRKLEILDDENISYLYKYMEG